MVSAHDELSDASPYAVTPLSSDAPSVAPKALPALAGYRTEIRALMVLAGPLILGFLGNNILGLVDTAMVGRLGENELAATAVGGGVFFAISCLGMGAVLGADPLLSQAIGAGEGARAEATRSASLRLAFVLSLPLMAAILGIAWLLPVFGVKHAVAHASLLFLLGRTPSVLPFLLFAALRGYLQARTVTRPIIIASIVANIVNFGFNAILIYGDGALLWLDLPPVGLPALGVLGSGIASSLATLTMAAVLYSADRRLPALPGLGDIAVNAYSVLRVGTPIGLTLLCEVGAFAAAGVIAARISANAGAGHQVAIQLASTTFIVTLAIGAATSVRVGQAVGKNDVHEVRVTGFLGLGVSTAFMCCTAILFLVFARPLAMLLSDQPGVVAASIPLIHIAAVFQIFDGAQAVGSGALRGIGDTRFIQIANMVGYYVFGLPIALLLAFPLGMAERGLWWGLTAGLVVVAVMLFVRFGIRSTKPIVRI